MFSKEHQIPLGTERLSVVFKVLAAVVVRTDLLAGSSSCLLREFRDLPTRQVDMRPHN